MPSGTPIPQRARNAAELIRAMPVASALRRRAETVLAQGAPSGSAAALARDAILLCDVLDTLADEVWAA